MAARPHLYQISIHVLLLGLAIMVVALAHQNRTLRALATSPEATRLAVGEEIPPIAVRDLEGNADLLRFAGSDRESLVLVFTTTCGACQQNQGNWRSLYEALREHYDVVGLSLDDVGETASYKEINQLPFRTFVAEDARRFVLDNKVFEVPYTIHLDRDGRIRRSWLGVLSDDSLAELIRTG